MSGLTSHIYKLGGRRFVLCVGAAGFSTILVWFGKVDQFIFRDIVLGTIGAYIAGNTIQAIKGEPMEKPT